MCCFTREAKVSGTRIFARLDGGRELLAYEMTFAADGELAMVLPVPTPAGSAEDAVRFLDLSGYPEVFGHLAASFVVTGALAASPGASGLDAAAGIERLEVHEVGAFDASFVPSPRELLRLDPRFRLSPEVLAALPAYADWGFVVFKLRPPEGSKTKLPHPMAFSFPTRTPGELFFPCVHVHDGEVHESAAFDHMLYAQLEPGSAPRPEPDRIWARSTGVLSEFADASRAAGLLEASSLAFRVEIRGSHPNEDVWVRGAPESQADAETRALSRARDERFRIERERVASQLRGEALRGRVIRALVGLPIAALLGFLVWIAVAAHHDGDGDGLPSAIAFAIAWVPSVWVVGEALTGRNRLGFAAALSAALLVAIGLLTGGTP